ncbi:MULTISPECIES: hypothetical protein [unclassified Streptomyces]|uniref:hypothetical protein n=1 Tax=unclassified Streptomyces TaxID=2593676 RepID=UPI002256FF2B|nr:MULTISPECIES: hypothetical protein [unclassified Streptomyces]MCX5051264.1 hypothetical protein [Streptomyces sp. NBC_00474]MCX5061603.1 hypothetical protein [Streptomyces sp. NBC_00452]MCX5249149.1 hypothetical protein [Streptomyces sp. NBC_00201]MCX5292783.1 hypothetical protein [Streptomyces sp. NBC_00183]
MNVLMCAACGTRLTEPLRLLPEVPPRPEYDGRKNPDGSRRAPSTVPRGAYAVDPEPCGAPYVPHPDPDWCDAAHPGNACMGDPDGQGFLMSAGPRDTLVVHPEDTRGHLSANPALREIGCCGAPGREGPNEVCAGCGAVAATLFSDCTGPYETHFLPDAVRVAAA